MDTLEILRQHIGKTIEDVKLEGRKRIIVFTDNTNLTLMDQRCNTCSGYAVEGSDEYE